jgi:hypothetical protein
MRAISFNDGLGFGKIPVRSVFAAVDDMNVDQWRRKALRRLGYADRHDFVGIELETEPDDRLDAPEMLSEHNASAWITGERKLVERISRQQKGAERLAVEIVHPQRPEPLLLDKGGGGAYLFVVADDQHLFCPQKRGQRRDIGLRSLIEDHEIEGAERGRKALGNPPAWHDPARYCRVGCFHCGARVPAKARSALAGAFADPPDGGEEHLQSRVHPPCYSGFEREQRPQPHDIVEEAPYLVVGAPPLLIQLAKPGAAVDRAEVGIGLSPDPGVTPIVGCTAIFDALDLPGAEGLSPIRRPRVGNRRRHPFNGIKICAETPDAPKLGKEHRPLIGDGARRSLGVADRCRQKFSDGP